MNKRLIKYKVTEYGEYEFVAKKMYSLVAIKEAHETPYTKKQTELLLKCLSKRYFKSRNLLWIMWNTKNRLNYGGVYRASERGKKIPYVDLRPDKKNKKKGIYGLRAGIVLHEFSHALADYNSNKSVGEGHGKEFIKTFNKVLRFYRELQNDQQKRNTNQVSSNT